MTKIYTGNAYYISDVKTLLTEKREVSQSDDNVILQTLRGGICGSDINYYYNGGIGDLKLQHPMLLGHEVIGVIKEAPTSSGLKVGQKVAINPSLSCGKCRYCLEGKSNHCSEMLFFGSALRNPHIHGGFADYLSVDPRRCVPYDNNIPDNIMCFAEPLSVAIHAVNAAGSLIGKEILVSGAGPIGCLIIAAAKACGAENITIFDISETSRQLGLKMGATIAIDPNNQTDITEYIKNKGFFDISFDASGVAAAIQLAIQATRPLGTLIQIGNSRGLMGLPIMDIVAKEITLRGSFRFIREFYSAVHWLEESRINPLPLLTAEIDAKEIDYAIQLAADKTKSAKVQLIFNQ